MLDFKELKRQSQERKQEKNLLHSAGSTAYIKKGGHAFIINSQHYNETALILQLYYKEASS
ncbi:hypothetical protein GCM10010917_28950 [Paenibacillus physcomitrellae]|uniref:Uncharacterized protein n=1 Tax=Paenibacillus physcomitrellae TaxID=1619311 RepID=A0ABQ1GE36_9BACL|nr:hypothetical protein GCM10010917_28950 [Paenibacillus physcomitrellae]